MPFRTWAVSYQGHYTELKFVSPPPLSSKCLNARIFAHSLHWTLFCPMRSTPFQVAHLYTFLSQINHKPLKDREYVFYLTSIYFSSVNV